METILCSIQNRKLINRGFLAGPVCPIYGIGMVLIIILLSPFKNFPLLLFLSGGILASVLEYMVSLIMEKAFNARWWDYSSHRFNLNGRISLSISVAWGMLTVIFLKFIHPPIASLLSKIPFYVSSKITVVFLIILLADFTQTLIAALQLSKRYKLNFNIDLIKQKLKTSNLKNSAELKQKLEELKKRLKTKNHNLIQKRLINAFPNLKPAKRIKEFRNRVKDAKIKK